MQNEIPADEFIEMLMTAWKKSISDNAECVDNQILFSKSDICRLFGVKEGLLSVFDLEYPNDYLFTVVPPEIP